MGTNTSTKREPGARSGGAAAGSGGVAAGMSGELGGLPAGVPAGSGGPPAGLGAGVEGLPARLEALAAEIAALAADDPRQLGAVRVAAEVLALRRLSDQPPGRVAEAEPVLLDAARRLDPGHLRRLAGHLRDLLDPDQADQRARARLQRRGLWPSPTVEGMLALDGLLDAEAGEATVAA